MIGFKRTGITIAIGIRTIPTGKDILTNGHQVPKAAREVQLVRALHGTVVLANPELTIQLESVPPANGLLRTKVQLESPDHGAQTITDRSPAGVSSTQNRTTTGKGPAGASYSRSWTIVDWSRFLRGPNYRRQTLWIRFLQEPYV